MTLIFYLFYSELYLISRMILLKACIINHDLTSKEFIWWEVGWREIKQNLCGVFFDVVFGLLFLARVRVQLRKI
jgi:hypothetical protein